MAAYSPPPLEPKNLCASPSGTQFTTPLGPVHVDGVTQSPILETTCPNIEQPLPGLETDETQTRHSKDPNQGTLGKNSEDGCQTLENRLSVAMTPPGNDKRLNSTDEAVVADERAPQTEAQELGAVAAYDEQELNEDKEERRKIELSSLRNEILHNGPKRNVQNESPEYQQEGDKSAAYLDEYKASWQITWSTVEQPAGAQKEKQDVEKEERAATFKEGLPCVKVQANSSALSKVEEEYLSRINTLVRQLKEVEGDSTEWKARAEKAEIRAAMLQYDLSVAQNESEAKRGKEIANLRAENEALTCILHEEVEQLRRALKGKDLEYGEQVKALQKELDTAKDDCRELRKTKDAVSLRLKESDAETHQQHRENLELQQVLSAAQGNIRALTTSMDGLKAQLQHAQKDLADTQWGRAEGHRRILDLDQRLRDKVAEMEALRREGNASEARLRGEILRTNKELGNSTQLISVLQQEIQALTAKLQDELDLQRDKDKMRVEIDRLMQLVTAAERQHQEEISHLEDKVEKPATESNVEKAVIDQESRAFLHTRQERAETRETLPPVVPEESPTEVECQEPDDNTRDHLENIKHHGLKLINRNIPKSRQRNKPLTARHTTKPENPRTPVRRSTRKTKAAGGQVTGVNG